VCYSVLQLVAVRSNKLQQSYHVCQNVSVCCRVGVLLFVAVCYSVLQLVATRDNKLQQSYHVCQKVACVAA